MRQAEKQVSITHTKGEKKHSIVTVLQEAQTLPTRQDFSSIVFNISKEPYLKD